MIHHIAHYIPADSQLEKTIDFTFDFPALQSIIRQQRRLR